MLKEYQKIFCCPDDGANITLGKAHLECPRCGRHFPIFKDNFIEMLPSTFPEWRLSEENKENLKTEKSYKDIFDREFSWHEKSDGWGDLSAANPGYRAFVKSEVKRISELISPSNEKIVADISGGVGNYSIPLSESVKAVFHCELDVESIQTAYHRGKGRNIFFIRTPYLKLPFDSDVFDNVVCTDTLLRGRGHELMLLTEIKRILKNGGRAVVDFHNPKLFYRDPDICQYNRKEIASLLLEADIKQYEAYPFGYVPSVFVPTELFYSAMNRIFSFIAPCQRYIVVFTKR